MLNPELATTPVDILRAAVAGNAYHLLRAHADAHNLGYVFPAGAYFALWKASKAARMGRTPDAAFVRADRLPPAPDLMLPFPGAPDLAVEVVTITETNIFTLEKVRDYLAAGASQAWMAFTAPLNELHVYRRDEPGLVRVYRGDDVLDVGDPLPGLRVTAAQLFRFP
jgi:Uma2 family endonuclease